MHLGELTKEIIDLKKEYPDLYLNAIVKMEEFQKSLVERAI